MAKKKKQTSRPKRRARTQVELASGLSHQLTALQGRVESLERDSQDMRTDMGKLSEELGALRVTVKQVDERTLRGEKLMMDMQLEQRKQSKVLDRIAFAVVPGEPKEGA